MIKYIGSKRVLVPRIVSAVRAIPGARRVLDLFSGTSRVGHALKREGFEVVANDHLAYAHVLARCYVEADARVYRREAERVVRGLSKVKPRAGYFTETFCRASRFFHPKNGARIDAIRERIERMDLSPVAKAIALTSLMEAADRVDSTTGLQMAYLKEWAPRAHNDLELRVPELLEGPGWATRCEAVEAASRFEVDVAYLDPPYNQHSYMGNYHVWETLVRWDKPEHYGTACKRLDCRSYHSPFNSKREIRDAMKAVLSALRCPYVIVSFNNEGYLNGADLEEMLDDFGHIETVEVDFKRYVGAQIGIFNPQGEKVGRVSHLRNRERLYIAGPDPRVVQGAARAARCIERK